MKAFQLTALTFTALALAALPAGCDSRHGYSDAEAESEAVARTFEGSPPIRAVATTGMVADIVANVGGEHVVVEALMGEGTDPHSYRPSPGDVKKLASPRTHIVFFNGLHLEGKMIEALEQLSRQKLVVAVTDGVPRALLRAPPEFQNQYDPHVWFDLSLWVKCVEKVRDVLVRFDPPRADDYRANTRRYVAALVELDEVVRREIASIPEERRTLVTAHDAFGYFGRAYGIEVLGVQGISTDSEAGVRRINTLVDLIVKRRIKAVFVESSVSEANIRALVEGCRARGHEIRVGGQLFSDAMGSPGTPEGTYLGMVSHNVRTIVEALK